MTRALTPWFARVPRLPEFELDFPRWMTEILGPEAGLIGREGKFMPEVNMVETEKAVEVAVELPGMKPEEVKVEIREGNLWIIGEKKEEKEEKGKTYHRVERRHGEFRRVLPLPAAIKEEEISAKFENGVLKVVVPKTEVVKPKQIEVKA